MAKAQIKDDELYAVVLTRSIKVGRSFVAPSPNTRLRGDILKAVIADNADTVASYEVI
jgi:hypothetical protein